MSIRAMHGCLLVIGLGLVGMVQGGCGDEDVDDGQGATTGTGASGDGGKPAEGGGGGDGAGASGAGGDGGGGGDPQTHDEPCDHEPTSGEKATCTPGLIDVLGSVDGESIDDSALRGWGIIGGSTFSEIGTFGLLYFPAVEAESGQSTPVRGLIGMPDESSRPGTFYCAGKGSEITANAESFAFTATLDSLSLLGACETATPVTGEVEACFSAFAEGCEDSDVTSTIPGATFVLPLAGGYDTIVPGTGTPESAWVFAGPTFEQGAVDVGGFVRLAAEGLDETEPSTTKTASITRAFFVVPDGAEDAGAVYCVGEESTVDYLIQDDGSVLVQRGTFKNLKRIGACPAADACVEGQLSICAP